MDFLRLIAKGMVIGVCNIIPGVSGGTAAVILGVFDDLIEACTALFKDFVKSALFLLPIGIGVVLGIFSFSSLMEHCLANYSVATNLFFIGLIAGSLPLIYENAASKGFSLRYAIAFLFALAVVIALTFLKGPESFALITTATVTSSTYLFVGGLIAAMAMVIPGISGSFIMVLLGLYPSVLKAVADRNIPLLIPLGIGVIFGILFISKLISAILHRFFSLTYFAILGLMVGSIFAIFYDPGTYGSGVDFMVVVTSCGTFVAGFILSTLIRDR